MCGGEGLMETEGVDAEETEGLIEKDVNLGLWNASRSCTAPALVSRTSHSPSYQSIITPTSSP